MLSAFKRTAIALGLSAFLIPGLLPAEGQVATPIEQGQSMENENLPEWFKDSKRLSELLGGKAVGNVTDAKVIRRTPTPIAGLDALVIEGTVSSQGVDPHPETFVIYLDKTGRYLVAGLVIDMEKNRNLGQLIDRQVRGERADNPALALDPLDMHGVTAVNQNARDETIIIVADLGPEKGRQNILSIHQLYTSLVASGQSLAHLKIIPVSAGKDEMATAAMAMAMGYDDLRTGDGYNKIIEFSEKGKNAPWLDKQRLQAEKDLKAVMGRGIFKLDDNSTQALLAKLNTLPLVYRETKGKVEYLPLPTSSEDWKKLFVGEK